MDFENPSDNLCWMKVGTVHDLSLDGTTFELKDAMPGNNSSGNTENSKCRKRICKSDRI